jgi:hypothetical protein
MKTAIPGRPTRLCHAGIFSTFLKGRRRRPGAAAVLFCSLAFTAALNLLLSSAQAQPIVNVNYGNLNFLDANRVHVVGSNGTAAGNKTLYRNVVTGNGQVVDCIITTESITNGEFRLPLDPYPGTIPFDYMAVSNLSNPKSLENNEDRFFTPTLFFYTGGGSVRFRFEFILGGSYNAATGSGEPVILRQIMINSYDIDGNTNCSTPNPSLNQFNDFSGFNSAARATPGTKISASYNAPTGMTRFMSTSNCNEPNITSPATRIRVEYNFMQEFEVVMGMTGQGRAFFILDFGPGPNWTPQYLGAPVLDLNTSTDSYNNSGSYCNVPVKFFSGSGNIMGSGNAINEFFISVPSADIINGNNERLTTDINNSNNHIPLGSPFSGTQTFTLSGISFRVEKSEANGTRTMRFTKSNGTTMTVSEAQTLTSALTYFNTVNTPGVRTFKLWFREGTTTSTFSFFELYGGCMILQARALDFSAVRSGSDVLLSWRTEDVRDILGYGLERSRDGSTWEEVGRFPVGQTGGSYSMRHIDRPVTHGNHQYRLVERYRDGRIGHSPVRSIDFGEHKGSDNPYPNPVTEGILNIRLGKDGIVTIHDLSMRRLFQSTLKAGHQRIDIRQLPEGTYILRADGRSHVIVK